LKKIKTRYYCDNITCQKSFSRRTRLNAHMHIHLGTLPHKCPIDGCGKMFSEKPNMIIHIRKHTKEKPYCCNECGKGFSTKGNM
jgi:uncharacterized Zn-finger protein